MFDFIEKGKLEKGCKERYSKRKKIFVMTHQVFKERESMTAFVSNRKKDVQVMNI